MSDHRQYVVYNPTAKKYVIALLGTRSEYTPDVAKASVFWSAYSAEEYRMDGEILVPVRIGNPEFPPTACTVYKVDEANVVMVEIRPRTGADEDWHLQKGWKRTKEEAVRDAQESVATRIEICLGDLADARQDKARLSKLAQEVLGE